MRFALPYFSLALAFALALTSCGSKVTSARLPANDDSEIALFSFVHETILKPKCLACHSSALPAGGIDYTSYGSTLSSGSVVPGNVSASSLYVATEDGSMPQSGDRLGDSELAALRSWIRAGATRDEYLSLVSVAPSSGSTGGSTLITLTGTGFSSGSDLRVALGGASCSSITIVSDTHVTCLTSAHTVGTVEVVASFASGLDASLEAGYRYQTPVSAAPSLSSVAPLVGNTGGGTQLTLTGSGFASGATVLVGGVSCSPVTVSATQLTCATGAHPLYEQVDVLAINPDGQTARLGAGFTYQLTASFKSISASVLGQKCLACHNNTTAKGGANYTTYDTTINTGYVIAGDADASHFYTLCLSGKMPQAAPSLPVVELNAMKDWLNAGALDD